MSDLLDPPAAAPDAEPDASGVGQRSSRTAAFVSLAVAVVMIGLLVLLVGANPNDESADSPLLGNPAPEALATDLRSGDDFDLSRRKGSWVVINFFQSDCRPCITEHPELIEFVEQQRGLPIGGAEFYSVAVGDTREGALGFFDERGGDWPVLYSENDQFSQSFGVAAVPETWIIDPDGFVLGRFISEVTADTLSVSLQQLREQAAMR
ncbi:MAG: TlpA disulfide reductase family protein [Actinomycetota bacterium]